MKRQLILLTFVSTGLMGQTVISVDAGANRKPIDPRIYGTAYATTQQLVDLNAPLNRYGGNNSSRYNWQANADNRGFDWYYQSIGDSSATEGERGDRLISEAKQAGSEAMLTLPLVDWVAKLGANRSKLASFNSNKYGAQQDCDWQWFPQACNGVLTNGSRITWNDENDASTPNSAAMQQSWASYLVSRWGTASQGGLRYYILDNEPSIWHSTHRDVQKQGLSQWTLRDRIIDYSSRIKSVDPGAQVVGPEEWGWSGYFWSGYDQWWAPLNGNQWSNTPEKQQSGMDYMPWLLKELKLAGKPLDIVTLHYYPQGGEFSNDTSSTMQARRNRSTRSLWDPNYTDETWISDKVQLIPRLRGWVDTHYHAGTPIGITEYNWGAESHINGATAQADIYGIFGREGLAVANRWTTPATGSPSYNAMKIYRNYDGSQSTFGDVSVRANVPNPDNLSAFAAERTADGKLTVMVVNKVASSASVRLDLANFAAGSTAEVWQMSASNTAIGRKADVGVSANSISTSVPAQSITLFVVPPSGGPVNQPPVANMAASPQTGTAPLLVTFSSDGSNDPDGDAITFSWNFGNGATATGAFANYTYTTAGTYTATLTVTDSKGASSSTSKTITVNPDPTVITSPTNLSASYKKTVLTLRWTDRSNNETGFEIQRAPSGTSNWVQIGTAAANATSWTMTGHPTGTWLFRVRAVNASGQSAWSNTATLRIR